MLRTAALALSVCKSRRRSPPAAEPLELKKGDHICIIGNTLAERMQHDGWLETLLHARFPKHDLVIRNLGFSGDEVDGWQNFEHRLRSMDFGTPDQWLAGNAPMPAAAEARPRDKSDVRKNRFELTNTKADVIFAFFGYNESFAGEAGLPKFKEDLEAFIKHTLAQKYNGKSAPRLVLFSPIAHGMTRRSRTCRHGSSRRNQHATGALHGGDGGSREGERRRCSSICSHRTHGRMYAEVPQKPLTRSTASI